MAVIPSQHPQSGPTPPPFGPDYTRSNRKTYHGPVILADYERTDPLPNYLGLSNKWVLEIMREAGEGPILEKSAKRTGPMSVMLSGLLVTAERLCLLDFTSENVRRCPACFHEANRSSCIKTSLSIPLSQQYQPTISKFISTVRDKPGIKIDEQKILHQVYLFFYLIFLFLVLLRFSCHIKCNPYQYSSTNRLGLYLVLIKINRLNH